MINKTTTTVLVNLTRKSLTLKVVLWDSDSVSPVLNANITLTADNTTQSKVTDATGSATFGVIAQTLYSLSTTAPNYQPRSTTIDMGAENQEVQYWLLSGNRFSVLIKDKDTGSPVSNAEVRVDSILLGKTDERGILITPLTRGKIYLIEIKKDGYKTYTETRQIGAGEALYPVSLSKAALGAFIYVTDENKAPLSGADIYLNGTLSGSTNEYGRLNFPNLVAGTYGLEVRKNGYIIVSRPISVVTEGQDYVFQMPLENAPLTIFVQEKDQKIISNATIVINGRYAGVTDDHGQFLTNVKMNTVINITSTKENYLPASAQSQVIQGNATGMVTLTMEKNLDWVFIGMIAIGAIAVLIVFGVIRMFGGRKRRQVTQRDEI
eukprot:TRINITY_DN1623_c0_g1_i2.p1 TRINITY_DN1623_c0_g1~~TRINITY_DN1623_c0_g1_i2.p1  ORF type:complete len:391 (-),score=19.36 TRINITY_DN1623_c0_g1_i2:63-1199(-)